MARLSLPVTAVREDGEVLEIEMIDLFADPYLRWSTIEHWLSGEKDRWHLLEQLAQRTQGEQLCRYEFPAFSEELSFGLARLGATGDQIKSGGGEGFLRVLQKRCEKLRHARFLDERQALGRYHKFLRARVVVGADISPWDGMAFDPWRDEMSDISTCFADEILYAHPMELRHWPGLDISGFESIDVMRLEDDIEESLSDFVDEGDIYMAEDFDGLKKFLIGWHQKHGIPLDWADLPDTATDPKEGFDLPDTSLLQDPELVAFIQSWNGKQTARAYYEKPGLVICNPAHSPEEVADALREELAGVRRRIEEMLDWRYEECRPEPSFAPSV